MPAESILGSAGPKRVLFVVSQPFYQWRGSPIRIAFNVAALAENGLEVDLLVLPFGIDHPIAGVTVHRVRNGLGIKQVPIGPSLGKLLFDVVLYGHARRMMRAKSYDVLHGVEDAGAVCALLALGRDTRLVVEKHSDPNSYRTGLWRNLLMAVYARVERVMIRRADAVIATGPGLAAQARAAAPRAPVYHIPDIPSSLRESTAAGMAAERAKWATGPEDVLITYVGSFAVYQGIDLLFDAIPRVCRRAPRARFIIIGGNATEVAALRQRLETAGVAASVAFSDRYPPDQLTDLLAASDILLSPRIAGANTPLKLLDYLKAGRAIVATDNPANRQILDDRTALLVPPDPEAFAAGICRLVDDAALRERLSREGRRLIDEHYNFTVFRRNLGAVYAGLAREAAH